MPAEKLEVLFYYDIKKQLQNIIFLRGVFQRPKQNRRELLQATFIFLLLTTEMDKN